MAGADARQLGLDESHASGLEGRGLQKLQDVLDWIKAGPKPQSSCRACCFPMAVWAPYRPLQCLCRGRTVSDENDVALLP